MVYKNCKDPLKSIGGCVYDHGDVCSCDKYDNLLPCPFCGGKAEIKQTGKVKMRIRCEKCFIGIEQKVLRFTLEWLRKTLIKSWNKRIEPHEQTI